MKTAIVLAGGLGTRLRTAVADVPKPLAPIQGRPFLAYLLDAITKQGVGDIILSVGYMADKIEATIGVKHGSARVRYARETQPLGTGGAIANAFSVCGAEAALVLNGDTLAEVDYRALSALGAGGVAVALIERNDADRYGVCRVEDGVIVDFRSQRVNGPALVNAGVYAVTREVFTRFSVPEVFSFERDFLEKHIAALRPRALVCNGEFIDIGLPESFAAAQTLVPKMVAQ